MKRRQFCLSWSVMVLLLASCASVFAPRRDSSRFFALSVEAESGGQPSASAKAGKVYGLGPVRLPDYLDRNEICTRLSGAELRFSEHERWAAPLRTSVGSILAQDLAILSGGSRVVAYPWTVTEPIDLQIEVDVHRFEAGADGKATLVARWTVRDADGKVLLVRESTHARDAAASDTAATVTALSEALADLAKDIAGALPSV